MDGMQIGAALAGNGRLTTDRPWVRWGVAAAITGMVSWVAGVAHSRQTGSSPRSSRLLRSSGSSPRPRHCPGRGEQPPGPADPRAKNRTADVTHGGATQGPPLSREAETQAR